MLRGKWAKGAIPLVLLMLGMCLLAGCGGGSAAAQSATASVAAPESEAAGATIRFSNRTGYTLEEVYVSSATASDWGENLLDAPLAADEATSLEMEAEASGKCDVKAVDNEGDIYYVNGVTLKNRTKFTLWLQSEGVSATVGQEDGEETTVTGELELTGQDAAPAAEPAAAPPAEAAPSVAAAPAARTGTGHDTNGAYSFTVNNNSYYDIYSIWVGIYSPDVDYDVDLLPEILPSGQSTVLNGVAHPDDWDNPNWTIYIMDTEGDLSASYDTFNPFLVKAVDVQWSNSAGGYVVDFTY